MYSAGALAIGGFGRSRLRLRRTRRSLSLLYGFSMAVSPFDRPECQKPDRRQRCVQHSEVYYRSKANVVAGKKPSREHAIVSVAPATSSKSRFHVRRERRWFTAGESPARELFAPPGSNRSGGEGNEAVGASGVEGRVGDSASMQAVT